MLRQILTLASSFVVVVTLSSSSVVLANTINVDKGQLLIEHTNPDDESSEGVVRNTQLPSECSSQPNQTNTNAVYLNSNLLGFCPPNMRDIRMLLNGTSYEGREATSEEQAEGIYWHHNVIR